MFLELILIRIDGIRNDKPYADPDPAKCCESDPIFIRIRIHNTDKEWVHNSDKVLTEYFKHPKRVKYRKQKIVQSRVNFWNFSDYEENKL
jgi:hypothetical protein